MNGFAVPSFGHFGLPDIKKKFFFFIEVRGEGSLFNNNLNVRATEASNISLSGLFTMSNNEFIICDKENLSLWVLKLLFSTEVMITAKLI